MAKSRETYNKKENVVKKQKKKQDKAEKRAERKTHSDKGKSVEEMFAYVDADGNITSIPPDPKQKRAIKQDEIVIGVARQAPADPALDVRKGKVTFFNEAKGYGFIKDSDSQQSVFVHVKELRQPIKENDRVTFLIEQREKGPSAVSVQLAS
ncbi:cold shock domain-containing protein [Xanthocytophaga agilis]|uniref:Cold shock domain-containing protein n=1 Tax=Xanthocytophaga agilis TaxID=3048010 RepID=A0AAE3UJ75_9BACT|nr:cold shock domain-containing protein [Xanthocytophaga agilis]MDJ1504723.1 cold shock domain-containing protein [Xanthocytophaga agilis]